MWLSTRKLAVFGAQLASIALLILIWQELVSQNLVSSVLVAPPSNVFPAFWGVLHSVIPDDVPFSFEQTLALTAIGTTAAAAVGIAGGIIIGRITFIWNVLDEYVVALYSLPKVALLPLFWVLFGLSVTYRLAFGFLMGVFPVLLIVVYAVKTVDDGLLRMAKSVGASGRHTLVKIILPSIVPSMVAGVRIGFVSTFTGILLAEMYVGNSGIGFLVRDFTSLLATTDLYVVVLASVLISVVVNMGLLLLERHFTRWKALVKT